MFIMFQFLQEKIVSCIFFSFLNPPPARASKTSASKETEACRQHNGNSGAPAVDIWHD